jgi:hypothetical protein
MRHILLPLVREQFNANVDDVLVRLGIQAREAQQHIEQIAAPLASKCVTIEPALSLPGHLARHIDIDCTQLVSEPPIVVREVLRVAWAAANWPQQSMGFAEWQLLAGMTTESKRQSTANLPSNVQVRRIEHTLQLRHAGLA